MSSPEIIVGDVWENTKTKEQFEILPVSHGTDSVNVRSTTDGREWNLDRERFLSKHRNLSAEPAKPKPDIEPGSVVQLKSGGFFMTVYGVRGSVSDVTWMDDLGVMHTASLGSVCLKFVEKS